MSRNFTPEELLTRWESRREIQNVMGKVSQSYIMMEEAQIYDRFWSKREDVCLGVNEGWYAGAAAVQGYYDAMGEKIRLASDLIAKAFPEKLSGKTTEELYGVGQLGVKPIDTFVIEIAEDGETAKGIWALRNTYSAITPRGPESYWQWGWVAADFVREETGWKIWHLLILNDVHVQAGLQYYEADKPYPPVPGFEDMAEFRMPEPNVKVTLREPYSPNRPRTPAPEVPKPYETFDPACSYGRKEA